MRIIRSALCAAILIVGSSSVYAWQPQDTPQGEQARQAKPMVTNGTVKAYEPGKSIQIDAKNGPVTYDLAGTNMSVTVSADVKVGSKVKVTEKTDLTGRKTVTIDATAIGTH